MERPNGAPDTDWPRKASEHGSNMTEIELSPARELSSAHERAPQMDPQNWVAHRKHTNEARGSLTSPTGAPDGLPRDQNGDVPPMGESESRTLRRLAKPVI